MIYKTCGRCRRRLPVGQTCPCVINAKKARDRRYDRERRDRQAAGFYESSAWRQMSDAVMARYSVAGMAVDLYAYYRGHRIEAATMVHHITPLRDAWEMRLDPENLVPLSSVSHAEVHRRMDAGEPVADELRQYKRLFAANQSPGGG